MNPERSRAENIFVLGLDDENLKTLRHLPEAADYRFWPLLSIEQLQDDEIDLQALLAEADEQLTAFDGPIDAIVGYWDFPVSSMVPILCGRYGLRSASLDAVVKCEHKYWSRIEQQKVIRELPRFERVDLDHADTLPEGLSYPVWLKPVKSFSSELAFRADDDKAFRYAVEQIRSGIGRVGRPFDLVLDRLDPPEEIADIGGQACIAEESVSGAQLTVEGYRIGDDVHIYGVVDSVTYPDRPSFLRYQYPSRLPDRIISRVCDISRRVIRQIGLDTVPFNIEFFADAERDRIMLLEVNPRHSQSHAHLFDDVDGVPNHQCMVRLALGRDPDLPHREGRYSCAAKWFLRRFADGLVRRVPTEAEIAEVERDHPGVTVNIVVSEGIRLSEMSKQDSYSYELAEVFVGADSEKELERRYEQCVRELRFDIDDPEEHT